MTLGPEVETGPEVGGVAGSKVKVNPSDVKVVSPVTDGSVIVSDPTPTPPGPTTMV